MATILSDFSQQTLAEAVEANMAEQFAYFRRSSRAEVDETVDGLRYLSGIPIAEYNGVIRARFAPDGNSVALAARIRATINYFAGRRQPFFWWVGPTSRPMDLGKYLTDAGLTHLGDGPGMAVDLNAVDERRQGPAGLDIVTVADTGRLRDWVDVAGAGYGEPDDVRQARYDVHLALGLGDDLPLQRYIAYLHGRPVAMSELFLGAGVAGVYDVATAKDARGQGVGAAVTLAPLRRARELGYRIGVLQASEMGVSMYSRLGFREVCAFALYSWEPGA